jgi:hypothetical protein
MSYSQIASGRPTVQQTTNSTPDISVQLTTFLNE